MVRNGSNRWTDDDDKKLLQLVDRHEAPRRIAVLLERSERAVRLRIGTLRSKDKARSKS